MPTPAAASAFLAALLALAAACAPTRLAPVEGGFEETVLVYRDSDPEKALALAADEAGRSAWGAAIGAWSKEAASERALETCRASAERRGVEAPCRLFALGDRPAEATRRACERGRAGARRCALQERHAPLLGD